MAGGQAPPPAVEAAPPAVHPGLRMGASGTLELEVPGEAPLPLLARTGPWTLEQARGNPRGTARGIAFDFGRPDFRGTLVFGLVPYHDTRHPQPVFRTSVPIVD